jgi:hypothetical protein
MVSETADDRRISYFRMGGKELRFELVEKFFPFFFYPLFDGGVSEDLGGRLYRRTRGGHAGRNPISTAASRTRVEVRRVV